jgi:hypothetical protein
MAHAGETAAARRAFDTAHALCPESAAPLAELAGLAFQAQDWSRAESLATRAVALEPGNDYAAALLATTQYVQGKENAALAAWNRIAEPRVDLAAIEGLERIRYDVVAELVGLPSGTLLTVDKLRLARRDWSHCRANHRRASPTNRQPAARHASRYGCSNRPAGPSAPQRQCWLQCMRSSSAKRSSTSPDRMAAANSGACAIAGGGRGPHSTPESHGRVAAASGRRTPGGNGKNMRRRSRL